MLLFVTAGELYLEGARIQATLPFSPPVHIHYCFRHRLHYETVLGSTPSPLVAARSCIMLAARAGPSAASGCPGTMSNKGVQPMLPPRCGGRQLQLSRARSLLGPCVARKGRTFWCSASAAAPESHVAARPTPPAPLKVVIAGAGISGLSLAVGLLNKGYEVVVLERDLTAIRGEGKYRGPIQVQSNALAALEALDLKAAERVFEEGCITGDRVNGLCDGITGEWYVKFDTYHPAADHGLPVTRVICRHALQWILAEAVKEKGGEGVIVNNVHVVDYKEFVDPATGRKRVMAIAEDGRTFEGDMLIGADGIWSKVRTKLVGHTEAFYSDYTCYTGISDFTPPDIDVVAYRVFLGNGQYFVSSDVGGGKMQWYAFHKEPPGGNDQEGHRKERLMELFGGWSEMVTDLIRATPEEDVLRRDIYDRAPIFKWAEGLVGLLGDSAHAMQPNLGQGGCMAIEDAYQLVLEISKGAEKAAAAKQPIDVEAVLKNYFAKRIIRVSSIHGFARFAANMASTYKSYLGEGLGPLSWIQQFKIPHPGKMAGQPLIKASMPSMLDWILGGYNGELEHSNRKFEAREGDKPKGFDVEDFSLLMDDDDALLHAVHAQWVLVPAEEDALTPAVIAAAAASGNGQHAAIMEKLHALAYQDPKEEAIAATIGDEPLSVGSAPDSALRIEGAGVGTAHAQLRRVGQDYYVTDLGSPAGTWLNGKQLPPNSSTRLMPGDMLRFGAAGGQGQCFKVKMQHESLLAGAQHGAYRRDQTPQAADAFAVYNS